MAWPAGRAGLVGDDFIHSWGSSTLLRERAYVARIAYRQIANRSNLTVQTLHTLSYNGAQLRANGLGRGA